jgi:hypothetical protein
MVAPVDIRRNQIEDKTSSAACMQPADHCLGTLDIFCIAKGKRNRYAFLQKYGLLYVDMSLLSSHKNDDIKN